MATTLRNKAIRLPGTNTVVGTGWLPPVLDRRDYTEQSPEVTPLVDKLELPGDGGGTFRAALPPKTDLRPWCSPIEDQQALGSCTAHAAVGIIEYYENKAFKKYLDGSRLFVYKNTRNLMGVTGDTGAWLRNTMGALVMCGVAEERYWPYTDAAPDFDKDPPPFIYAIADNFESVKYFCHDPLGKNVPFPSVLASVKKYLASGVPSMFGFWGYQSSMSSDVPGAFAIPSPNEPIEWGHAVAAVGYDDNLKITNTQYNISSTGALLIRNSWGTSFGTQGYGWIPYEYVLKGMAMDFWSLLKMGWISTDQFQFGVGEAESPTEAKNDRSKRRATAPTAKRPAHSI